GPARAKDIEVLIMDSSELRKLDPHIAGIVGQNFLLQHNYLIDYRQRLLSFELTDEIQKRVSGERIPLAVKGLKMMVSAETKSGAQDKLLVSLDCGASLVVLFRKGSLAANAAMKTDMLEVATKNGNRHFNQARIPALKIGSQTFHDLTVA